jgi:hypothetical protein
LVATNLGEQKREVAQRCGVLRIALNGILSKAQGRLDVSLRFCGMPREFGQHRRIYVTVRWTASLESC